MNTEFYYLQLKFLAQAYGCGTYGTAEYNECETEDTSTPPVGSLSDTGILVGVFVATAVVVMIAALAVRLWRSKKDVKKSDSNETDQ